MTPTLLETLCGPGIAPGAFREYSRLMLPRTRDVRSLLLQAQKRVHREQVVFPAHRANKSYSGSTPELSGSSVTLPPFSSEGRDTLVFILTRENSSLLGVCFQMSVVIGFPQSSRTSPPGVSQQLPHAPSTQYKAWHIVGAQCIAALLNGTHK